MSSYTTAECGSFIRSRKGSAGLAATLASQVVEAVGVTQNALAEGRGAEVLVEGGCWARLRHRGAGWAVATLGTQSTSVQGHARGLLSVRTAIA